MNYFRLLRPFNWIKNFFIFVPIFFAKNIFALEKFQATAEAFLVFCLLASSVYIVNDILDIESDKNHSYKKDRPLASGKVSVAQAVFIEVLLLACVAGLIYYFIPQTAPIFLAYWVLNLLYSLFFKHIAVLDIVCVAIFYLLRVVVGAQAAQVPVSEWLILCTLFLSLFLIIGKRKAEYREEHRRKVLASYTGEFLNGLLVLSAGLSIISFSLYTILVAHSDWAVYSVIFVILGIFRYTLLVFQDSHHEMPEKAIFGDPVLLAAAAGWAAIMFKVFY